MQFCCLFHSEGQVQHNYAHGLMLTYYVLTPLTRLLCGNSSCCSLCLPLMLVNVFSNTVVITVHVFKGMQLILEQDTPRNNAMGTMSFFLAKVFG